MKKSLLISFIVLLLNLSHAYAQTKDSLLNNINEAATDSLKIEALYEYMRVNLNNNTSDFEPYIKQMVLLSRKINFKWGLSTAYILGLSYYKNQGKFELALKYADSVKIVTQADTTENMRLNMGHLHLNRGNLYYNIGDYKNAMQDYFEAERIFKQIGFKTIASVYQGMSNCFMSMDNHQKALEFSKKAVNSSKEFDDKRLLATTMMNMATEYMNIDNYKAADSVLNIVWPVVEKLQNSKSFHVYYYNKGDIEAYYKKDTLKALTFYQKSYDYALLNEDVWQQGKALESMINFQLDINHNPKKNIDILYRLSEENNMRDYKATAFDYYSRWYNQERDYKKAYEFLKKYQMLSDSVHSEEAKEKITIMEIRFRVANKDREIKSLQEEKEISELQLKQKNTLNYIFIGSTVSLVIISLLIYLNYRHRQKLQQQRINELETEKQLTAVEAILKGEEQERTRLAKDLHDGLGGMLSGIKYSLNTMKENMILTASDAQAFEHSIHQLDNSINEMRRVAHNLMPESLVKFGLNDALTDFCKQMSSSGILKVIYQSFGLKDKSIDRGLSVTTYRIAQELLNNIVKHANATQAIVQISASETQLSITVEDNGVGVDLNKLKEAQGIGWKNIQSRVDYHKGTVSMQSTPDKGTSVYIEFSLS
ncbi:MAG: sensor histidine kinase [Bacteroidetes bacterium]|nr:sensor histidine kinase [Bacteroidota bacterium]